MFLIDCAVVCLFDCFARVVYLVCPIVFVETATAVSTLRRDSGDKNLAYTLYMRNSSVPFVLENKCVKNVCIVLLCSKYDATSSIVGF